MIESLISRLKLENEKLCQKISELSKGNNTYEICTKILNSMNVTKDEIEFISKVIEENKSLNSLDKETLEFILFIAPTGDTLDSVQKQTIEKFMNMCEIIDLDELNNKLNRNEKFIDLLENKQIFVYFEQLIDSLKEYGYETKDIFKIIKLLIKNNYTAEIKKEEQIFEDNNVEKSNIEIISQNEVVEQENDSEKEIDFENSKKVEESNTNDNDDIEKLEIINSDSEILNFFKKYKLYYGSLDEIDKNFLRTMPIDFEDRYEMFDLLKANGFNIKNMYSSDPHLLVAMIIKSNKDMVNNVITLCKDRGLEVKRIYKTIQDIFLDSSLNGRYDNFIKNIEFLDSINFNYLLYNGNQIYNLEHNVLKYRYEILTDLYGYELNEENFEYFYLENSFMIIDGIIEIGNEGIELLQYRPNTFLATSINSMYTLKNKLKLLQSIPESNEKNILRFNLAFDEKYDIYEFKEEPDELSEFLNSKLILLQSKNGDVFYDIPITEGLSKNVLENPLVKILEEKYLDTSFAYNIHGTRISRFKVLRALTYFSLLDIEITEEVVKYAMKINYIFVDNDLKKINNLFRKKIK